MAKRQFEESGEMTFGYKVELLRHKIGKSGSEMAVIMGITPSAYSQKEGSTDPKLSTMKELATLYKVHPDYFLYDLPPDKWEKFHNAKPFLDLILKLSPSEKFEIYKILKAMDLQKRVQEPEDDYTKQLGYELEVVTKANN